MKFARLVLLLTTTPVFAFCFSSNALADVLYGWSQQNGDASQLYSYPSGLDLASNTNGTFINNAGSQIFNDIATDGTTFYGWSQQNGDASQLYSYPSALDLASNTNGTFINNAGSQIFNSIATDGNLFYGWSQQNGDASQLYSYPSALDLANNTNGTFINNAGSQIFNGIAAANIAPTQVPEPNAFAIWFVVASGLIGVIAWRPSS